MNWIILIVVSILIIIAACVIDKTYMDILPFIMVLIAAFTIFISLIAMPLNYFGERENISLFKNQKEYIELHQSNSDVEDAAITTKKIELNEWLYRAQYSKKHYDGWTYYPDEILEMKPIQ